LQKQKHQDISPSNCQEKELNFKLKSKVFIKVTKTLEKWVGNEQKLKFKVYKRKIMIGSHSIVEKAKWRAKITF